MIRRVTESMDRFLADDRRFWTEEYRFRTGDRGYATVFDRAYVAHDEDGAPVRVVGTLVDLTERRRIHEEQRFLSQASMILDLSLDYESTLPTIARLAVNIVADACLMGGVAGEGSRLRHRRPRRPAPPALVEEVAGLPDGRSRPRLPPGAGGPGGESDPGAPRPGGRRRAHVRTPASPS
jgi:hypothetical protein